MDKFYVLRKGMNAMTFYLADEPKDPSEAIQFELDLYGGKIRIDKPVHFKFDGWRYLKDFMIANPPLSFISDKVLETLKKNNITGWKTYPVKLHDKKGKEIPGYHGLSVTGKCGPILKELSKPFRRKAKVGDDMIDIKKGYYFDEKTWDGKDMFVAEGTGVTFVTEKVKEAMELAKISNVQFIESTEFEILWD